jgi:hypothetical protein
LHDIECAVGGQAQRVVHADADHVQRIEVDAKVETGLLGKFLVELLLEGCVMNVRRHEPGHVEIYRFGRSASHHQG